MSDGSDHFVSFLVYSMVIYPITGYLVSPRRSYSRRRAALYAVLFLVVVAGLQLAYTKLESGPNYYQVLGVTRSTSVSTLKKTYRAFALELHPDKNKAESASDEFQRVKQAFDVLADKDKRREYNRLGKHGVEVLDHQVIDARFIVLQLIVRYGSSLVFAFILNLSENGDTFSISVFGLSVMLLIEMLFVVQDVQLPNWLLPSTTPYEIVESMHQLFPAFMNGTRSVLTAFQFDRKKSREDALEAVVVAARDVTMRCENVIRHIGDILSHRQQKAGNRDELDGAKGDGYHSGEEQPGSMAAALREVQRRIELSSEGRDGSLVASMKSTLELVANPANLVRRQAADGEHAGSPWWMTLVYLAVYLAARQVVFRTS